MGGDRRSPPHHRGRGSSGGRTRSHRGGAALSGSNGMINQSFRFNNENSASKKQSVLKKDSGLIFVQQNVDLAKESQTCIENQDLIDQEFNNSYEDENVEKHSVEGKGKNGNLEFTDSVINSDYNLLNRNYRSEDKLSCCLENREPVNQEDMDVMIDGDMRAVEIAGDIIACNSMLKKVGIEEGHPFMLNDKGSEGIEEGVRSESVKKQDKPDLALNKTKSVDKDGFLYGAQDQNNISFKEMQMQMLTETSGRPSTEYQNSDMRDIEQNELQTSNEMEAGEVLLHRPDLDHFHKITFTAHNPIFWHGEVGDKLHLDCNMGMNNLNDWTDRGGVNVADSRKDSDDILYPNNMDCMEGVCQLTSSVPGVRPENLNCRERDGVKPVEDEDKDGRSGNFRVNKDQPNAWKKPAHVQVEWNKQGKATIDGKFVNLNMEAVNQNQSKLEKAIVGRLIGKRLPFNVLENELRRRWDPFGEFRFLMIGDDSFTCIFNSNEARDAVLMGGPWLIGGFIVGLDRWTPTFSQGSMNGLSALVWIRMPNLPLLYWDNDNLARIASMIGTLLWIDAQTSMQGRCSYARVCVRLDLAQRLPTGVWIHGVEGNFFQRVEFEGLHHVCFSCGDIGHKKEVCEKKGKVTGKVAFVKEGRQVDSKGKVVSPFGWNKEVSLAHSEVKRTGIEKDRRGAIHFHQATTIPNLEVGESSGLSLPQVGEDGNNASCDTGEEEDNVYGPWIYVTRRKGKNATKVVGARNPNAAGSAAVGVTWILNQGCNSGVRADSGNNLLRKTELPVKGSLYDRKGKQVALADQTDRME